MIMNSREMLKTITPQEKELIARVMERARQKRKEREGDNIKLSLWSHGEGGVI